MVSLADSLVKQAVAGDEGALAELLQQCTGTVAARLAKQIDKRWRPVLDVADVMQVTYLEVFLRIRSFVEQGPGSFQAWLTQIAENNLKDAIRELSRQKRPPPARQAGPDQDTSAIALLESIGYTSTTPSRAVAAAEARQLLEAAVARLPQDYATVLRLYDLGGQAITQVTASMSRSAGAVHMLRARAREHLRDLIGASGSRVFWRQP